MKRFLAAILTLFLLWTCRPMDLAAQPEPAPPVVKKDDKDGKKDEAKPIELKDIPAAKRKAMTPAEIGAATGKKTSELFPRGMNPTPRHKIAAAPRYMIRGDTPDQYLVVPQKLSYWLNNQYGDCVTAAMAFIMATAKIFINDDVVYTWARQHGVLNGADIGTELQQFMTDGFKQDGNTYNVGPSAVIDFTNDAALRNALSKGPVSIGVASSQFDNTPGVGSGSGWVMTGYRHDSGEDHNTVLCGYGTIKWLCENLGGTVPNGVDGSKPAYAMFTWNGIGVIDRPSLIAVTGDAWAPQPVSVVVGSNPPVPDPVVIFPPPEPTPPQPPTGVPVITSPTSITGTMDQPLTYTITATNAPMSFAVKPHPKGLHFNAKTGEMSGTVHKPRTASFTVTASNASGPSAPVVVTLTVTADGPGPGPTPAIPLMLDGNAKSATIPADWIINGVKVIDLESIKRMFAPPPAKSDAPMPMPKGPATSMPKIVDPVAKGF